jgi:hypothetical protein
MSELLFIYNAKSGAINNILDIGHKLISPETYSCHLCALTHNTFSENKVWKNFREQSHINMAFFHIDEFENEYPDKKFAYPVILLKDKNGLTELVSSTEINTIENFSDLIKVLIERSIDDFE